VLHSWRWPRAATTCPSADHARARTAAARIPLNGYDSTGRVDAKLFLSKQGRYRLLAYGSFIDQESRSVTTEAVASSSMGG
jgi:hypothetical protein